MRILADAITLTDEHGRTQAVTADNRARVVSLAALVYTLERVLACLDSEADSFCFNEHFVLCNLAENSKDPAMLAFHYFNDSGYAVLNALNEQELVTKIHKFLINLMT